MFCHLGGFEQDFSTGERRPSNLKRPLLSKFSRLDICLSNVPSCSSKANPERTPKCTPKYIGYKKKESGELFIRHAHPLGRTPIFVSSTTKLACVLAMLTKTLAAALSTWIDRKMVAPSFVTLMPPSRLPTDCKILSMPTVAAEQTITHIARRNVFVFQGVGRLVGGERGLRST